MKLCSTVSLCNISAYEMVSSAVICLALRRKTMPRYLVFLKQGSRYRSSRYDWWKAHKKGCQNEQIPERYGDQCDGATIRSRSRLCTFCSRTVSS